MVQTLVAVVACLAALAVVQRVQDNDSAASTPGLTATFTGKAFSAGTGSEQPVMTVKDLRRGGVTAGTVTVGNPGPSTRYFWLSQGRVSQRLGAGGGRLTSAVALTVIDVSDISAPSVVYRGPLRHVGARPLGFLDPGARRSFSFVAERPPGGRSPVAPSVDPYRGATARIGWTWHSIPGRPDTPAAPVVPKQRDTRAPALRFSVPRRQQLLERRALALTVRCDEDCSARPRATMSTAGRTWPLAVTDANRGMATGHALTARLSGAQATALRREMLGSRPTKVRVAVEAHDRSGNRRRDSKVIKLRPRR